MAKKIIQIDYSKNTLLVASLRDSNHKEDNGLLYGLTGSKDDFIQLQTTISKAVGEQEIGEKVAQDFLDGFKGEDGVKGNPFSEELEACLVIGIGELLTPERLEEIKSTHWDAEEANKIISELVCKHEKLRTECVRICTIYGPEIFELNRIRKLLKED